MCLFDVCSVPGQTVAATKVLDEMPDDDEAQERRETKLAVALKHTTGL
jgi:hypothetical protein